VCVSVYIYIGCVHEHTHVLIPSKEIRRRLVLRSGLRVFAFPFCFCEYLLYEGHLCTRRECRVIGTVLTSVQGSYEKYQLQ